MFRLAISVALGLLLSNAIFAQQTPAVASDSVPIFAIELGKIQWQKNPAGGPLEVATVVGDRSKPGLYIQLVRWPAHTINKAHSHPDDRYAVVLQAPSITVLVRNTTRASLRCGRQEAFSRSRNAFVISVSPRTKELSYILSVLAHQQTTILRNNFARRAGLAHACLISPSSARRLRRTAGAR